MGDLVSRCELRLTLTACSDRGVVDRLTDYFAIQILIVDPSRDAIRADVFSA